MGTAIAGSLNLAQANGSGSVHKPTGPLAPIRIWLARLRHRTAVCMRVFLAEVLCATSAPIE
jgi:hypothetical protein